MTDDLTISQLLGTLYAAPTTPRLWEDFLRGTSDLIGAEKAALIAHDTTTNAHRVFGSLGDGMEELHDLYAERYWQYDEWTRRGTLKLATQKVLIGSEVWPEPAFKRSIFYNEFLKLIDICDVAGVGMAGAPGKFEVLSVYRGHADQEFSAEHIHVLEVLLPHLQIAMATRRRLLALELRLADIESAFNVLESAVVLLDAAGRVVLANEGARSILSQGQGLCLKNLKLIAQSQHEAATLRDLIAKAIATAEFKSIGGGGAMPVLRAGKKPLQLLVSPLRSEGAALPGRGVVAVFLSDPERSLAVPAEVLRTLFGLTPAEARLALSLFEGHSLSEAAELNRVGRETVKSQIASVFLKTGARRQSELVRLLARLPIAS
jgi:DNA-binding CsgD family transcriptional regulator/PAS domain-containing protein